MSEQARPQIGALAKFFGHRRVLANPMGRHQRLAAFFEGARNLGLGQKGSRDDFAERARRPDAQRLGQMFNLLSPLIEARRGRFRYNPWQMSGLGRYEVRNSAVLGQLFDQSISPVAGPLFLARYLQLVSKANGDTPLPAREALVDYRIGIEHCPLGHQSERVDLTVEGANFVIGIEIKIDAGEGPEQLERYIRVIEERAGSRNCPCHPIIFLSPRPSGRGGDVLESSWRHVSLAARDVANEIQADNPRAAWLLACFAEHVRKFY